MAVIIIKKEPDPKVVKEVVCRNCGVTLQYLPCDVTSEIRKDYTGDSDEYKHIKCANCNQRVPVS